MLHLWAVALLAAAPAGARPQLYAGGWTANTPQVESLRALDREPGAVFAGGSIDPDGQGG